MTWLDLANCAGTDPEAFFPDKGRPTAPAQKVCANCEVKTECGEHAINDPSIDGVWGGLTVRQRQRIRMQRKAA